MYTCRVSAIRNRSRPEPNDVRVLGQQLRIAIRALPTPEIFLRPLPSPSVHHHSNTKTARGFRFEIRAPQEVLRPRVLPAGFRPAAQEALFPDPNERSARS